MIHFTTLNHLFELYEVIFMGKMTFIIEIEKSQYGIGIRNAMSFVQCHKFK